MLAKLPSLIVEALRDEDEKAGAETEPFAAALHRYRRYGQPPVLESGWRRVSRSLPLRASDPAASVLCALARDLVSCIGAFGGGPDEAPEDDGRPESVLWPAACDPAREAATLSGARLHDHRTAVIGLGGGGISRPSTGPALSAPPSDASPHGGSIDWMPRRPWERDSVIEAVAGGTEVVAGPFAYLHQLVAFLEQLRKIDGVRNVTTRHFADRMVHLRVRHSPATDLAKSLLALSPFVVSTGQHRVELRLRPEASQRSPGDPGRVARRPAGRRTGSPEPAAVSRPFDQSTLAMPAAGLHQPPPRSTEPHSVPLPPPSTVAAAVSTTTTSLPATPSSAVGAPRTQRASGADAGDGCAPTNPPSADLAAATLAPLAETRSVESTMRAAAVETEVIPGPPTRVRQPDTSVEERRAGGGAYGTAVAAVGVVVAVASILGLGGSLADPLAVIVLAILAAAAQRMPVGSFASRPISMSFAVTTAAYVLHGTPAAVLVSVAAGLVGASVAQRKPLGETAFGIGALTISAFCGGTAYQLLAGPVPSSDALPTVLAVAVSASVLFVVHGVLDTAAPALVTRRGVVAAYRARWSWLVASWMATWVNGTALVLAWRSLHLFGVAAFVMPLGIASYSFGLYTARSKELRRRTDQVGQLDRALEAANTRLEGSHLSVVGALIGALEAKGLYDHGDSTATMAHAAALARKLVLSEEDVATVELAALFHDIGEIGLPEHIVGKQGPLTPVEREQMEQHTLIGVDVLARVPTLGRIRPIIQAHHERYDGTGYPGGLAGKAIPLTAQIIAVVDSFQALTHTRAYRHARSQAEALAELRRCAGSRFDPVVVEAFIELVTREARRADVAQGPAPENGSPRRASSSAIRREDAPRDVSEPLSWSALRIPDTGYS